ncbi:MAG: hypothetical protein HQK77_15845 [Desulfobacterales bacterium]|nr:hypothetical protein [Desulfobacterales bacterium]
MRTELQRMILGVVGFILVLVLCCPIETVAGNLSSINCPPKQGYYMWENAFELRTPKGGCVVFEAKATNDIHVCFATSANETSPLYETVIGGWRNTASVIRRGKENAQGMVQISKLQNPLAVVSENRWESYWMCVDQGNIQVGRGSTPGKNTFLQWQDPMPLTNLKWVAFSSWDRPIEYKNIRILPLTHQNEPKDFNIILDAVSHCSDLQNNTLNVASHPILPGKYKVTLKSNIFYNRSREAVKKAILYVNTEKQPFGWFYTIDENEPLTLKIGWKKDIPRVVYAMVLDYDCQDNTGEAIIHFEPIEQNERRSEEPEESEESEDGYNHKRR